MSNGSFEESLRRLETIVSDIENKDLPLEEVISQFEEGMKTVKMCEGFLTAARLRVDKLIQDSEGGSRVEEFVVDGQE